MLQYLIAGITRLKSDERGQDMMEWALLAAFAASVGVAVLPQIAPTSSLNTVLSMMKVAIDSGASY